MVGAFLFYGMNEDADRGTLDLQMVLARCRRIRKFAKLNAVWPVVKLELELLRRDIGRILEMDEKGAE